MSNSKAYLLLLSVSLLQAPILAAPPSVCNNAPYKDLLPLSAYVPAINFCSMNYLPSLVTVTAGLAVRAEAIKRATSTIAAVATTTAPAKTTVDARSTSSVEASRDPRSNKLSSLQAAAHEVISMACLCILPQRTVTVTRTTSNARREMSTTTPAGVVGPGRTTFITTTASDKVPESTTAAATTTSELDPQSTYCSVRGVAQTTAFASDSSGSYTSPPKCSNFCQNRRGPGGRLALTFGLSGSTCNCYWKAFTDTCKPDASGNEYFYDIKCPVGSASTVSTSSLTSTPPSPAITLTTTTTTVGLTTSATTTVSTPLSPLPTCGGQAVLRPNVYPYYYDNNGVAATPEKCKTRCSNQKDPNLKSAVSFSLKDSQCACYTQSVPDAFVASSTGPYRVFDMGCTITTSPTPSRTTATTPVATPTATCSVLGQWRTGTTAYWADYPHHNKTPAQCRAACLAAQQPKDNLKTYFVSADDKCVCFNLALTDIVIPDPDGPETFYDVNCPV